MAFLTRIFASMLGGPALHRRAAMQPLYDCIIAAARQPHWYREGRVPDSVTGRFDMLSSVLALVLLRLEADPATNHDSVALTELFIDDMDGSVREMGFGDLGVGKQVGKLVAMLGGRLDGLRGLAAADMAAADMAAIDGVIARNIYRGDAADAAALAHVRSHLRALAAGLAAAPVDRLLAGEWPEAAA